MNGNFIPHPPAVIDRIVVALFFLVTLAAHAIYAWLVLWPNASALVALRIFLLDQGPPLFACGQIFLSFIVLAWLLRGHKWTAAFAAICALGFTAEFIGVSTGMPFGRYYFTDMLGPKILGVVPWVMPLAWFNIAFPSHVIASAAFPKRPLFRRLLGAWLMLVWDLSIDPFMAHVYPYWVWKNPGPYYGIPISNFAGWFFVGVLAMTVLDRVRKSAMPKNLLAAYYAANLAMPVGLVCLSGMWPAAALSIVSAGLAFWAVWISLEFAIANGVNDACTREVYEKNKKSKFLSS
jgi:uncharacterized membrane protein